MKAKLRFVAVLLPLILVATPLNAATTKAGAICKKVGAVSVTGGKKFTCIKSGKKLIWNKGVTTKPKPIASASPTSAPTPKANLFESVPPNITNAMTWENVLERRSEAAPIVYADTWETIKRNRSLPDLKIPYQVFKGPNRTNLTP